MTQTTRRLVTLALLTPGLPVLAQSPSPPPASAAVPASQAEPGVIINPGGPTWMVADVGIALLVGLVVGYLLGVRRGAAKASAGHA